MSLTCPICQAVTRDVQITEQQATHRGCKHVVIAWIRTGPAAGKVVTFTEAKS